MNSEIIEKVIQKQFLHYIWVLHNDVDNAIETAKYIKKMHAEILDSIGIPTKFITNK